MNEVAIQVLIAKTVNDTLSSPLTQAMVEKTSTLSAEKAITNSFIAMGIDSKNPLEVQQDMAFVRSVRIVVRSGAGRGFIAGVGLVFAAITSAVTYAISYWLRG